MREGRGLRSDCVNIYDPVFYHLIERSGKRAETTIDSDHKYIVNGYMVRLWDPHEVSVHLN